MTHPGFMLPAVYEGATWDGINVITLTDRKTNKPLNLRGATAEMIYRRIGRNIQALNLQIGSGISILSEIQGKMRVERQILPLYAGLYFFELGVHLSAGPKLLILAGTQEITRLGVPS